MRRFASILGIFALLFFSSCSRFKHWTYHTFHSAEKLESDLGLAHGHLRRVRSYYQLNTVALFDVLWLSDEVRQTYVDLYAQKYCARPEDINYELKHQLHENDHFITFYIMMSEEEGIAFGDKFGKWTVSLDVGDFSYAPVSVKIIDDLAYEWRKILGDSYNCFKTPYEVKFDTRTLQGSPILNSLVSDFTLCVSSIDFREYCYFSLEPEQIQLHHVHMD